MFKSVILAGRADVGNFTTAKLYRTMFIYIVIIVICAVGTKEYRIILVTAIKN